MAAAHDTHALTDLALLVDLPPRTIRYYVQLGLVDRPEGETRAARYGARHVEQLLLIRKWTAAGVSLDRIRELLHGGIPPVPERRVRGSIDVRSHILVSDGVDVVVEPGRAGLNQDQLRHFFRGVLEAYEAATKAGTARDSTTLRPSRDNPKGTR